MDKSRLPDAPPVQLERIAKELQTLEAECELTGTPDDTAAFCVRRDALCARAHGIAEQAWDTLIGTKGVRVLTDPGTKRKQIGLYRSGKRLELIPFELFGRIAPWYTSVDVGDGANAFRAAFDFRRIVHQRKKRSWSVAKT
jgi:hypothetical protein